MPIGGAQREAFFEPTALFSEIKAEVAAPSIYNNTKHMAGRQPQPVGHQEPSDDDMPMALPIEVPLPDEIQKPLPSDVIQNTAETVRLVELINLHDGLPNPYQHLTLKLQHGLLTNKQIEFLNDVTGCNFFNFYDLDKDTINNDPTGVMGLLASILKESYFNGAQKKGTVVGKVKGTPFQWEMVSGPKLQLGFELAIAVFDLCFLNK